ncbi:polysaccharide pyruvyl transferase family protein [Weissella confusa]|uniref:polysaccharide pyruvyl transferase family protein n=1 Tax=Weissella confusa TaxID=1583 RepID=UPI00223B07ED|nr:polysaccharide pyruvyl transferase family protein [Weissella confusa]MCS9992944.1 polysaccharide pyruvyl transferase family protein [Weissella confusa]
MSNSRENRIAILTFQGAENSGASLQAYALQEKIKELGFAEEVVHLNYINEKIASRNKVLAQGSLKQAVALLLKKVIYMRRINLRREKFATFDTEHLKLTSPLTKKNIAEKTREFGTFIVGSDQVFNTEITGHDETYLLDFTDDSQAARFGYATSFGDVRYFNQNIDYFRSAFERFDNLTFREKDAADAVENTLGGRYEVVVDPTMLHDRNFWLDRFPEIQNRPIDKEYLLIYAVNPGEKMLPFAKKYASDNNLEIVYLNTGLRSVPGVINIFAFGPVEFLKFINNATATLVTSFHGLVFSTIFEKQFAVELLEKQSAGQARLTSLMNRLEIQDRDISKNDNPFSNEIDYDQVQLKLQESRDASLNVIREWW